MAKITFESPIEEAHGSFTRDGFVVRQKTFRAPNGRIIKQGHPEAYIIRRPRDLKATPPTPNELSQQNRWREACHRTAQIIQAAQPNGPTDQQLFHRQFNNIPTYYSPEQARELYDQFYQRFLAQLPATRRTHPDAEAPIDPITGQHKRYAQLPAFIRTIIYNSLKSQP
ncbi:MAG: hypothetical protein IJQ97_05500 [Paludibacteraceae bacterium]|nr:hypothetical protein [Paludibacteraceae bacterium]